MADDKIKTKERAKMFQRMTMQECENYAGNFERLIARLDEMLVEDELNNR